MIICKNKEEIVLLWSVTHKEIILLLTIWTSLSVEDTTLREEVYHNSLCVILTGVRRFSGK